MQSQKKNSRSYLIKHNSTASQSIRQIFSNKRKLSVASQTDTLPSFTELNLYQFEFMTTEEMKNVYSRTMYFLNRFHRYMNKNILDVGPGNNFEIPEIPNYYKIFELVMKSCKGQTVDKGTDSIPNKSMLWEDEIECNGVVGDSACTKKELDNVDCQYLKRNNVGDGPVDVMKIKNTEEEKTDRKINDKTANDEMFQFDTERRIFWSHARQVKSERDIKFSPNRTVIDSLDENLNCCRTFQSCINENVVLNTKQAESVNQHEEKSYEDVPSIDSTLNLMEYTLKKLSTQPNEDSSDDDLSEAFLAPNVPDILSNYFNTPTLNKVSHSPHKVNEMFKRISKASSKADDPSFKYDNMYIKYISSQDLVDEGSFCENCKEHCTNQVVREGGDYTMFKNRRRWNIELSSSSECILSDEEFNDLNKNGYLKPEKESLEVHNRTVRKEIPTEPIRSHPLELTERDRCFADEKMLKAIGLFTENGDIRPGILEILESEQRCPSQNPSKNMKFRTERKLDVEVRFNNKNINMDANKSDDSISDKDTYDVQKADTVRSSAVTISSSVSDSDLIDMLPSINYIE